MIISSETFWNIQDSSVSEFQEYRKDSETGTTTADGEKDVVTWEIDLYNNSSGAQSYHNGSEAQNYHDGRKVQNHLSGIGVQPYDNRYDEA